MTNFHQFTQVPKFKAQPLPDFHEVHLPEKKVLEPTKPAPFKLMADERGAVKGERWEQMVSTLFSQLEYFEYEKWALPIRMATGDWGKGFVTFNINIISS